MSDKPLKRQDLSAISISEARQGNYQLLIARVMSGEPLTVEEREIIRDALDKVERKRGKDELKRVDEDRIAYHFEELTKELGSADAAVKKLEELSRLPPPHWNGRKLWRSTIFKAAANSKERAAKRESKKRK
jgi:hypothetical protein